MMQISLKQKWSACSLFILLTASVLTGCGKQDAAAPPAKGVEVKAMHVIRQDVPIAYEFIGTVEPKNEVQIRAKVSGNIIEKMVTGGAQVAAGQPLFRIDSRQYNAAVTNSQAQAAQSEAILARSRMDVERYRQLAGRQAVAQQVLDNALSEEKQMAAAVKANWAKVEQAQSDLEDTLIVAPFAGRIDVNDLSLGSFVQAGSTVMATISSIDPVMVRFSMNENEYLKLANSTSLADAAAWGKNLKLILSDGSEYPLAGQVEQMDKGLAAGTGTLTFKASFPNPNKILVSGMFGRVVTQGEIRPGSLLVPQRAVQQLLDKTIITIINVEGKTETRAVKMGARIGNMWVVESGLTEQDLVIVEGFLKTPPGTLVNPSIIGPDDLKNPAAR